MKNHAGAPLPPGRLEPLEFDLERPTAARTFQASIGKKYLMAVTGLFWCLFILFHLLGNFVIYAGAEAYNGYSATLESFGAILIAVEVLLAVALVVHMGLAVHVTLENRRARPQRYAILRKKGGRNDASRSMILTGLVILAFIVLHLMNLKFGQHRVVNGEADFHGAVMDLFQSPVVAGWYVVAVILLGMHVGHGLESGLRTLGWYGERAHATVHRVSVAFGIFIALGYASIPIWAHFFAKGVGA